MRSLGCECYRDAHKEDGSEPDWKPLDGDAGSGRQPARSTERHPKVATNRGHRDGGGQTFPLAGGLSRWRTIHGFDALLVLTGSTASANL
jgi:hypothetical protein